jgi:diaminopimelate epimerase
VSTEAFCKLNGAGNDFVLFDKDPSKNSNQELQALVQRVCRLHFGVGADGAVFTWVQGGERHWRYFNSDGSETGVCGNAARCLAYWLSQGPEKNKTEWSWKGLQGTFRARKTAKGPIEVNWPLESKPLLKVPDPVMDAMIAFNDHGLAGVHWIKAGVPHLVLTNHEVWNDQERLASNSSFRFHPTLGKEGANITWLSLKTFDTVTYERGVEAETLACGSGALAAYLAFEALRKDAGETPSEATFKFPGGSLSVRREGKDLWLSGPTELVFKGELI